MLPPSRLRTHRLSRLGLLLAGLGLLLLTAAAGRAYWQASQAKQAQQAYLARVFLPRQGEPALEPPFLTGSRQPRGYTAGQTALAFASGFQPHEPIFVRLYHAVHGLLAAELLQADVLGQVVLSHPLNGVPGAEAFTPSGKLWFQAESLSGMRQEFTFRLEPGAGRQSPAPTQGVYPSMAVPGSTLLLWCSGQKLEQSSGVDAVIDGRPLPTRSLDLTIYPVLTDGLLLAKLSLAADVPTGDWVLQLGNCRLQFSVHNLIHSPKERP